MMLWDQWFINWHFVLGWVRLQVLQEVEYGLDPGQRQLCDAIEWCGKQINRTAQLPDLPGKTCSLPLSIPLSLSLSLAISFCILSNKLYTVVCYRSSPFDCRISSPPICLLSSHQLPFIPLLFASAHPPCANYESRSVLTYLCSEPPPPPSNILSPRA